MQVTIFISELDLPKLDIDIPIHLINRKINQDEEIKLDLNYKNASPDNLFYAGVLIYDFDNVATMKFEYLTFKFRISNHFTDF